MLPTTLLFLLLIIPPESQGRVLRVDADASGASTGSTWADAIPDLQEALRIAAPDDELWIAEGIHKPTGGTDRDASFRMEFPLALYGGFNGTETVRSQADPARYESVLSGAIGRPDREDNSRHVMRVDLPTGASLLMDGLVIRDGDCEQEWWQPPEYGAGIWAEQGELILNRCRLLENRGRYGGAVYCKDPLIARATRFENNSAEVGGAIFASSGWPGSSVRLEDCSFLRNDGSRGGALYVDSCASLDALRCEFSENHAGEGGAIFAETAEGYGMLALVECRFVENVAGYTGGAIFALGQLSVDRCQFLDNSADYGGAIYCRAILGSQRIANSLFEHNRLNAIEIDADDRGVRILYCTIISDPENGFGSVRIDHGWFLNFQVVGCILWRSRGFGTDSFLVDLRSRPWYARPVVLASCIQGLRKEEIPGSHGEHPRFRDSDRGDYRLNPHSPCIDRGDPEAPAWLAGLLLDLDGRPRFQGAAVDIGAFEMR